MACCSEAIHTQIISAKLLHRAAWYSRKWTRRLSASSEVLVLEESTTQERMIEDKVRSGARPLRVSRAIYLAGVSDSGEIS
jgi:hypothetical protein